MFSLLCEVGPVKITCYIDKKNVVVFELMKLSISYRNIWFFINIHLQK